MRATEAEALAAMREGLVRAQQGLPVKDSRRPLEDWLQTWLTDIKAHTVKPWTLDLYRNRLQHVVDRIGDVTLAALAPADVRRVYTELLEAGLSPTTVHAIHSVLKTALDAAVRDRLILRNPLDHVTPPRPAQPQYRVLDVSQVRRLISSEEDPMWRALWALLATTGIRIGEATALTWDEVDLPAGELHIADTLARVPGGGSRRSTPKTAASRRHIHLSRKVAGHLTAWRDEQRSRGIMHQDRFVFLNQHHAPLGNQSTRSALRRTLKRAGLPMLRIHDLRHSAATNLLAMGEPVNVVAEMLGHASPHITLDRYGHASPAMHRAAAARLDALL